jgi:uncharacterized protein YdgA (DUF945 family)
MDFKKAQQGNVILFDTNVTMAPAIKTEKDTEVSVDQEEQMDVDATSEVEEIEEEEEGSDEEMEEEEGDIIVSADKIEIVSNHLVFCLRC